MMNETDAVNGLQWTVIRPIERLALADQVIDRLASMLTGGHLKPGDRLPSERDLCKMLGVSRPSLRQALKALDVLGIVEVRHGAGVFVSTDMPRLLANPLKFMSAIHGLEIREISEMRRIIEVALAGLAAKRADDEDIKAMDSCLVRSRQCLGDLNMFLAVDAEFHEALFRAARNRAMQALMLSVGGLLRKPRYEAAGLTSSDLPQGLKDQEELLQAIKDRNPDLAREIMRRHLDRIERTLAAAEEGRRAPDSRQDIFNDTTFPD